MTADYRIYTCPECGVNVRGRGNYARHTDQCWEPLECVCDGPVVDAWGECRQCHRPKITTERRKELACRSQRQKS